VYVGDRPLPGPGEVAWTHLDRTIVAMWQAEQDATCPGCGRLREECMDEENFLGYVATSLQCHACAARDQASRAQDGGEKAPDATDGQFWSTRLKEVSHGR
jgi:hypothetical protein